MKRDAECRHALMPLPKQLPPLACGRGILVPATASGIRLKTINLVRVYSVSSANSRFVVWVAVREPKSLVCLVRTARWRRWVRTGCWCPELPNGGRKRVEAEQRLLVLAQASTAVGHLSAHASQNRSKRFLGFLRRRRLVHLANHRLAFVLHRLRCLVQYLRDLWNQFARPYPDTPSTGAATGMPNGASRAPPRTNTTY